MACGAKKHVVLDATDWGGLVRLHTRQDLLSPAGYPRSDSRRDGCGGRDRLRDAAERQSCLSHCLSTRSWAGGRKDDLCERAWSPYLPSIQA
jgi:hypothetical protein